MLSFEERGQTELNQSELIMDTCFFCNKTIENEDDYILIGLVQEDVAELVPAHQDCANKRVPKPVRHQPQPPHTAA